MLSPSLFKHRCLVKPLFSVPLVLLGQGGGGGTGTDGLTLRPRLPFSVLCQLQVCSFGLWRGWGAPHGGGYVVCRVKNRRFWAEHLTQCSYSAEI